MDRKEGKFAFSSPWIGSNGKACLSQLCALRLWLAANLANSTINQIDSLDWGSSKYRKLLATLSAMRRKWRREMIFSSGETIKRLIYSSMDMCITFIFFSQHLRPVLIKAEKIVIVMAYVAVFTSSSNLYFSLLKFAVLISFSFFFLSFFSTRWQEEVRLQAKGGNWWAILYLWHLIFLCDACWYRERQSCMIFSDCE